VGAGLEFQSREWIEEHVDFTDYVSTGDGMWAEGFKEGVYTDDTEMTIGLVCALPSVLVFTLFLHWLHAVSLIVWPHR
jgi:ADP-ribosylglycohydrolase